MVKSLFENLMISFVKFSVLWTTLTERPIKALNKEDLPALVRPTNNTELTNRIVQLNNPKIKGENKNALQNAFFKLL